jgi:hypothetical protein
MNRLLLIVSVGFLYLSPVPVQSPLSHLESYSFQDIQLGMSVAEFKIRHPTPVVEKYGPPASPLIGQASCFIVPQIGMCRRQADDAAKGIVGCSYAAEPIPRLLLRIQATFIDGKLAEIMVRTPGDDSSCLEPPSSGPDLAFYLNHCGQYSRLWKLFTDNLPPATTIVEGKPEPRYHALRWQNETSIAEFQNHYCAPWSATDNGRAKAISEEVTEVLAGTYCAPGDTLSARQPIMLYLHKELGRALATRLREVGNP